MQLNFVSAWRLERHAKTRESTLSFYHVGLSYNGNATRHSTVVGRWRGKLPCKATAVIACICECKWWVGNATRMVQQQSTSVDHQSQVCIRLHWSCAPTRPRVCKLRAIRRGVCCACQPMRLRAWPNIPDQTLLQWSSNG